MAVGDTVKGRIFNNAEVAKLLDKNATPKEIIEQLFIRSLCRRPTTIEKSAMRELVGDAVKDRLVYEDIFWSLLNSTEFAFHH
jgi:hypothetical protein